MKRPRRPLPRPEAEHETTDRIDAEAVKEVLQSHGWQLIRQRIEKVREMKVRELIHPKAEIETASLRGAIAALGDVLRIPEILKTEGKESKP